MIHESMCPINPSVERKETSVETKTKISQANKGRVMSDTTKEKIRQSMKRAVLLHPESYTSSNRGRVRQIEIDGIKLHGSWELTFYIWAKSKNLKPERVYKGFSYAWNGSNHTYFPDFYLAELDVYVEVKGYETDRDKSKWDQFPFDLILVKRQEIIDIKKGIYRIPVGQVGLEPTHFRL